MRKIKGQYYCEKNRDFVDFEGLFHKFLTWGDSEDTSIWAICELVDGKIILAPAKKCQFIIDEVENNG